MVRYDQGHRERTRLAIIEAAATIMREKGIAEASVGNVMKAVGLTHGGFYAHFADKSAMIATALEKAFEQSPKNFAALAEMSQRTGDAGLVAEHYLAKGRVLDVANGCPAAALVSEVHRQDETIQAAFRQGAEKTRAELSATPGLKGKENDHSWAALSMLVGALSIMRAMGDPELEEIIRSEVASAMRLLAAPQTSGDRKNGGNLEVEREPQNDSRC